MRPEEFKRLVEEMAKCGYDDCDACGDSALNLTEAYRQLYVENGVLRDENEATQAQNLANAREIERLRFMESLINDEGRKGARYVRFVFFDGSHDEFPFGALIPPVAPTYKPHGEIRLECLASGCVEASDQCEGCTLRGRRGNGL